MSVEVRQDNTGKAVRDMKSAIERALEKIGLTAERYAKGMAPKDTGRLQNSITHRVANGERAVYIGTNVEYAPYQELGTSRMKAANGGKGFLRPAATEHGGQYRSILESELRKG